MPLIGINTTILREEGESANIATRATYVDAVLKAGGTPVILPPVENNPEIVASHGALCDGFIFIGGPDIDPKIYGRDPHPTISYLPPRRQDYDFALIKAVIVARKPFLAICCGMQEVNVALGGTLIRDIPSERPNAQQHSRKQTPWSIRHDVEVHRGTQLFDIAGGTSLSTNSAHHQAVDTLAPRLRLSATAADGIIESYELADYEFGIGVQWHPEYLVDEPAHLRLFQSLVHAAIRASKNSAQEFHETPSTQRVFA